MNANSCAREHAMLKKDTDIANGPINMIEWSTRTHKERLAHRRKMLVSVKAAIVTHKRLRTEMAGIIRTLIDLRSQQSR